MSKAQRLAVHAPLFLVAIVAVLSLSACDDESSNDPDSSASTSGSGTNTSNTNTSNTTATASDASTSSTTTTTNPGVDPLAGADGIAGTFDGMPHTATVNAVHVPQQTANVVIGAAMTSDPLTQKWMIRFKPEIGTQACTGDVDVDDIAIVFGDATNPNVGGSTGSGGTCTIQVLAVSPKYEGSFVATLKGSQGEIMVTEGYFRVPN